MSKDRSPGLLHLSRRDFVKIGSAAALGVFLNSCAISTTGTAEVPSVTDTSALATEIPPVPTITPLTPTLTKTPSPTETSTPTPTETLTPEPTIVAQEPEFGGVGGAYPEELQTNQHYLDQLVRITGWLNAWNRAEFFAFGSDELGIDVKFALGEQNKIIDESIIVGLTITKSDPKVNNYPVNAFIMPPLAVDPANPKEEGSLPLVFKDVPGSEVNINPSDPYDPNRPLFIASDDPNTPIKAEQVNANWTLTAPKEVTTEVNGEQVKELKPSYLDANGQWVEIPSPEAILMTQAPEIEGLEKYVETVTNEQGEEQVVVKYRASEGNLYGVEASTEVGYFKPDVYIVDEEGNKIDQPTGVGLSLPVIRYLLSQQPTERGDLEGRMFGPLPFDPGINSGELLIGNATTPYGTNLFFAKAPGGTVLVAPCFPDKEYSLYPGDQQILETYRADGGIIYMGGWEFMFFVPSSTEFPSVYKKLNPGDTISNLSVGESQIPVNNKTYPGIQNRPNWNPNIMLNIPGNSSPDWSISRNLFINGAIVFISTQS